MAGAHSQSGFSLRTEKVTLIHQRMSDAFKFNGHYSDQEQLPAEIVWSADHFSPRQIVAAKLSHLPAILCVESGFFGGGNIDCIASGQVAVVQGIYKQCRVLAIPLKGQGQHFSLPVLGYRHTFVQTGVPSNDSKGSTLDVLLKAHKLPIDVKFADNELHQQYGGFTLVKQYDELYLYGHNIADGSLCLPMVVIPVYLDITMSIGEGVVNGNANDWLLLKDIYIQESQRLLKDVIICGYMDMASFDSTWQQREVSERPNSACDLGIGDQKSDEEGESGDDSSDGDDDRNYSYMMPSKYIKICIDLSADDSTSLSDDVMVKIEGLGGILSLTLSEASRLLNSGRSRSGSSDTGSSSSLSSRSSSDSDGGRGQAGFRASGSGSDGKRPPVSARPRYVMLSALSSSGGDARLPSDGRHVLSPPDRGRQEDHGGSLGHVAASDKPNKPLPALPVTKSTLSSTKTTFQESATPTSTTRARPPVAKSTLLPTETAHQESATLPLVTITAHASAGQGESEQPPSPNRWPRVEAQHPQRVTRAKLVDSPAATDHHPSGQRKPSGAFTYDRLPPSRWAVHGNDTVADMGKPGTAPDTAGVAGSQLRTTVTTLRSVTARMPVAEQQQQQPGPTTGHHPTAARQGNATAMCQVKASTGIGPASTSDKLDDDSDLDGYEEIDTVESIAQAHVMGAKLGAASLNVEAPHDGGNLDTATPTCALTSSRSIVTAAQAAMPASTAMANRPLPVARAPVHRSMSNPGRSQQSAPYPRPAPSRDAVRASGRSTSEGEVGSSGSAVAGDPDAASGVGGDANGLHLQQAARAVVPGCRVGAVPAASAAIATTSPEFPMTLSDLAAGDVSALTNEQLCRCLRLLGMERCADSFEQDAMIDGVLLLEMTVTDLCGHFSFTEFEAKKIIMFARGWRPRQK